MTGIERAVAALETQQALADLCGVQQPAVSRWVKRGFVPETHRMAVAEATGVPMEELMPPAVAAYLARRRRAA